MPLGDRFMVIRGYQSTSEKIRVGERMIVLLYWTYLEKVVFSRHFSTNTIFLKILHTKCK